MVNNKTKRIFMISDTHLGCRSNSVLWLQIIEDYFFEFFIPLVKKYVRKESCLLCMDIMTLLQTAGVDIPEFKKNMGEYNHEAL